jgi:GT2 family glycosyltransferase
MTTSATMIAVDRPDVTVVLVSYNTVHLLEKVLAAIDTARNGLSSQVIVVDNASIDGSGELLMHKYPQVELIANQTNIGFARANNQAVTCVRGRYVLLLNTDAFVSPDTLHKTIGFMDANPRCGVLGVKLIGRGGLLQPSCRYFPTPWNLFLASTGIARFLPRARLVDDMSWDHKSIRECDWVPGCYYLVRREVIDQVGLFDPRYFLYYEEVDHCRRVRKAGWSVFYYPFTEVVHIGGESAASEGPLTTAGRQITALKIESELLYFRKHYGLGGLVSAVLLATVSDVLTGCKGLIRCLDANRARAAARHACTTLKLLVETRLASRATR